MTQIPKGEQFLPEYSYQGLKTMYKHETNAIGKTRLQACMLRKHNYVYQEIAETVGYPLTTIKDWLTRIHKQGLERRYNKKQPGNKCFLTKEQKKQVSNALEKIPALVGFPYGIWTSKILGAYIKKEFNVDYKIRALEELVHELGFNFKKSRPEHIKANKKLQEDFKKTSNLELKQRLCLDGRSYFLTKASFR